MQPLLHVEKVLEDGKDQILTISFKTTPTIMHTNVRYLKIEDEVVPDPKILVSLIFLIFSKNRQKFKLEQLLTDNICR